MSSLKARTPRHTCPIRERQTRYSAYSDVACSVVKHPYGPAVIDGPAGNLLISWAAAQKSPCRSRQDDGFLRREFAFATDHLDTRHRSDELRRVVGATR